MISCLGFINKDALNFLLKLACGVLRNPVSVDRKMKRPIALFNENTYDDDEALWFNEKPNPKAQLNVVTLFYIYTGLFKTIFNFKKGS